MWQKCEGKNTFTVRTIYEKEGLVLFIFLANFNEYPKYESQATLTDITLHARVYWTRNKIVDTLTLNFRRQDSLMRFVFFAADTFMHEGPTNVSLTSNRTFLFFGFDMCLENARDFFGNYLAHHLRVGNEIQHWIFMSLNWNATVCFLSQAPINLMKRNVYAIR